MSEQKNIEYDQPYDKDDYKTFSTGENDELGCKTCGAVFCGETFDEDEQHCSKCDRLICPYCMEGEEDREDTGEDEEGESRDEVLCVYCATGRISVNDLAKAFISLAEKQGLSVGELYKNATS
jgi:hypothetical protein